MMSTLIFILGCMCGGFFGVLVVALCVAAKSADNAESSMFPPSRPKLPRP